MELDYTKGCVNFRDVGEWVNTIAGKKLMPEKRIYRGGKIKYINDLKEIGSPGTILNLTKGPDQTPLISSCDYFHFPISNDYEKYDTKTPEVRKWLHKIMGTIEKEVNRFPVFMHCASGKDRTGVVTACLLAAAGIKREIIVEEYMLSEGDVKAEWITGALEGIEPLEEYFNRTHLEVLKNKILK
jgi:protein-tyrosine phosphatase